MANDSCVYLVGAGPGDPGLLTVRALRLLEQADVVVYDRLVSAAVMALVPDRVSKIFVGKASGDHPIPQAQINELLVRLARRSRRVVRLKGGDPFVFGRGGEEAAHLAGAGIRFEVVPGVTAASACAAYAGIPLTYRELASGVHLIAGHCRRDLPLDLDPAALANPQCTLVIYMGLANLERIVGEIVQAGRAPATPAAIIEWGTTPEQRCLLTELGALPDTARDNHVRPPALLIVGEVVSLAPLLAWYQPPAAAPVALVSCA